MLLYDLVMQVSDLLLYALFGFIQVLAEDSTCWPYFKPTHFVDTLTMFTKMQTDGIKFMSIYTLSLLIDVIPIAKQDALLFEEETIIKYIDILAKAISSPDLTATMVFGSLVIPADDILRILKQVWHIDSNRSIIISCLQSLISLIQECLQRGNIDQKKAAMELLWTIISDSNARSQISGENYLDFELLKKISSSGPDDVDIMSSCLLYKLHPEFTSGK